MGEAREKLAMKRGGRKAGTTSSTVVPFAVEAAPVEAAVIEPVPATALAAVHVAAVLPVMPKRRGRPPKVVAPLVAGAPALPVEPRDVVPSVEAAAAVPPPADPPVFDPAAADPIEAVLSPAVASDPIPPADMLAPLHEGTPEMATVLPNLSETMTTEKLQSLFGDMGARFKTSFEKSSKMGEDMVELTKGNVEAVVASARVAAKGGEALGQDAAEYTKKSFESAVAAMKSFASVKSPTELFTLQSEFAKASFDSAVAEASKFSESMMKLAGDVAQPLSTRYAVAAEKIKTAAL